MGRDFICFFLKREAETKVLEWGVCPAKQFCLKLCFFSRRMLYRCKQRGHLELDLILGKWAEENIEKLDDKKLKSLIEVLDLVRHNGSFYYIDGALKTM